MHVTAVRISRRREAREMSMAGRFLEIYFTPEVLAVQARYFGLDGTLRCSLGHSSSRDTTNRTLQKELSHRFQSRTPHSKYGLEILLIVSVDSS